MNKTVTVIGVNYEGAHFRGIASATDDRLVQVDLVGSEKQIVDFILENMSYGACDNINTLEDLKKSVQVYIDEAEENAARTPEEWEKMHQEMLERIKQAGAGTLPAPKDEDDEDEEDGTVMLFEGCGGFLKILEGDNVLIDLTLPFGTEDDGEPTNIGTIDLTGFLGDPNDMYDVLTHRIRDVFEAGGLPKRDGDPGHNIYKSPEDLMKAMYPHLNDEELKVMEKTHEEIFTRLKDLMGQPPTMH